MNFNTTIDVEGRLTILSRHKGTGEELTLVNQQKNMIMDAGRKQLARRLAYSSFLNDEKGNPVNFCRLGWGNLGGATVETLNALLGSPSSQSIPVELFSAIILPSNDYTIRLEFHVDGGLINNQYIDEEGIFMAVKGENYDDDTSLDMFAYKGFYADRFLASSAYVYVVRHDVRFKTV